MLGVSWVDIIPVTKLFDIAPISDKMVDIILGVAVDIIPVILGARFIS